jgi:hypothetical protein
MDLVGKDCLVPLIAPAVAIKVPTILFFVIPRRGYRLKAALGLITASWTEDMRQVRRDVSTYFVNQVRGNP